MAFFGDIGCVYGELAITQFMCDDRVPDHLCPTTLNYEQEER